jgi:hypothetical protein
VLFFDGFLVGAKMNQKSRSENRSHVVLRGRLLSPFVGALLCASLLLCGTGICNAQGQTRPAVPGATQEPDVQGRQSEPSLTKGKEPQARISKFEARQFRHACQERANERGLKAADRESFLTRCFFGRRAQRGARHECTKLGTSKGLDKAALHDFVRECLKEQRAH